MSLNRKDIQIKHCQIEEVIPFVTYLLHYGNQNPLVYFAVCEPNLEIKNHEYEIFIYYSVFALKVDLNRLFASFITEITSRL